MEQGSKSEAQDRPDSATFPPASDSSAIVCPVCGAIAVPEKCKVICKSETCRGRIILNCAEF